jgi:iron complex outermembrane receptor protein
MHWLSAIPFAAFCLAAAQVQAQGDQPGQSPQDQPRSQQRPTGVETITVTAEKVTTNIQDTALSIQALSERDLDNLNITNTAEVGTFVPGVNFLGANNTNAQLAIFMRGTGSADNDTTVNSATALYIDGVYVGTGNGAQFDLLDIERIEVLKGPQGTLFGRNTIGGVVSVVSKRPGPEWGGRARVQLGQHGEQIYRGSINVPLLGEKLFSRVSLLSRDRDYFFSPKSGDGHDDDHQEAGRVALRWLPTSTTTVDWAFDRIKIDNHNPAAQLRRSVRSGNGLCVSALGISGFDCVETNLGLPANFLDGFVRGDNGAIATDGDQFTKFDTWQNALTLTWDVNEDLEVKSISGWRKYLMSGENDLDGTPFSIFHSGQHAKHRTYYQELQAVGSTAEGFWDYVVGGTWFEEETDSDNFSNILEDAGTTLLTAALVPNGSISNTGKVSQDAFAWGLYTQHTLHLTDQLEATAGLRYSNERKEMFRGLCRFNPTLARPDSGCPTLGPSGGGPFPVDVGSFADDNRATRFDNWSPMGRLTYHWTDDILSWLSWTRGYRSGGFNNRPSDGSPASLAPFEEETISQWETGMKTGWLDNRLQVNWSGYYSEYDNQQIAIFIPGGGTATVTQNAGKSRIRGYEVDVRAVPVDGLEIILNHAFTNSDFSEFIASPGPGLPAQNLADVRTFPVIPKRTYAGLITYTFVPQKWGTLEMAANFRRFGKTSFLVDDLRRAIESNHFTVYGARVSLIDPFGVEGLMLSVVGMNVTDRSYRDNGINFSQTIGVAENTYGDPRHVAFEMTYNWGSERY